MKKTFSIGLVMVLVILATFTQEAQGNLDSFKNKRKQAATMKPSENKPLEQIRFKLKNNRLLPTKLSVISYRPGETGNGTQAFYLGPYGTKAFSFPVGTKIFLANQEQVNTVMAGKSISDDKPFLVVSKDISEAVIHINP